MCIQKKIIQNLEGFDVIVLINILYDSLVCNVDMNLYSIERKKIILKILEDINNG